MTQLAWKGYTWNLASRGPADPFVNSFAANHVTLTVEGYVKLSVTNDGGGASTGAEMASTTEGLGYGTYKCVVAGPISGMHPNIVFGGMFTYDADSGYGNREIDFCEQSAWSGATGPWKLGHVHWQSQVVGNPYGTRGSWNSARISGAEIPTLTDAVQTTVAVWEPGRITYRTYHGDSTAATDLYRQSVINNGDSVVINGLTVPAVVPVPRTERVHFNLWVCPNWSGTSDPATVTNFDVIIRDFSYTPPSGIVTSIRVLSDVVWALLQGDATIPAFDNPNYTTPTNGQWRVFYPEGGYRDNDRAGGIATRLRWGFQLVCVGRSRSQVLNVVDKSDALFIGRSLDSNSYTGVLYQEDNGAQILPDVGDPIGPRFTLTRQYRLTTRS